MAQSIRLSSHDGKMLEPCEHITLAGSNNGGDHKDEFFFSCEYKIPLLLTCNVCHQTFAYSVMIG